MNIKNMNIFGGLTSKQIEKLEKEVSLPLPADYREFLMCIGGASVDEEEFNVTYPEAYLTKLTADQIDPEKSHLVLVPDLKTHVWVRELYGYQNCPTSVEITSRMKDLADELIDGVLLIGESFQNGYFILLCKDEGGEEGSVYYWNADYMFQDPDDENNTYWVADSFTEFLQMLNGETD